MQQYYGIDLDHAIDGAHTVHHIGCLVEQLPPDARVRIAHDADAWWTLNDVLTAQVINSINSFIYGMSDKSKRGKPPETVGPSWMKKKHMRSIPARVLPVNELMRVLELPRGGE